MSSRELIRIANEIARLERLAIRPRPRNMPRRRRRGPPSYKDYVERKKKDGERPLPKEMWESRQQGGRALLGPNHMEEDDLAQELEESAESGL